MPSEGDISAKLHTRYIYVNLMSPGVKLKSLYYLQRRVHNTIPVRNINYKHYCGHLDGRSPGSVPKRKNFIELVKTITSLNI